MFVDTYRCYYMLIAIWIFHMGIKFWEDLFSQVFNFAIFYNHEKRAKLKTRENK